MRVLICSAARFGIANVVNNVIEELEDSQIHITYCRNPLNPSPDWCETIDLLNKQRYEKISSVLPESIIYRPVHLAYGILLYWHRAFNYIKQHSQSYDVVWLHSPHPMLLKRNSGCADNIMVTLHSEPKEHKNRDGFDKYYYKYLHDIYKNILSQTQIRLVTGVGPNVISGIEDMGISPEKTKMVPSGVDTNQFKPSKNNSFLRTKLGLPEDRRILLSLGRFTESKRQEKVLKVFSEIESSVQDVTLVMAGEGERLPRIRKLKSELGAERVEFLPFIPHEQTPEVYASADYFILASKYEAGYPPLTLAEAMASGLPCIVSDIECGDIVRQSDCGIVVNFDSDNKGERVRSYISNRQPNHSENARRFAENELSWKAVAEDYVQLFEATSEKQFVHKEVG